MNSKSKVYNLVRRIEQMTIVRAVRNALVSMIPVLMIGAFALILQTLPIPPYQKLLETPVGGVFMQLFNLVYSGTFGVLSVYMTAMISYAYIKLKAEEDGNCVGAEALLRWHHPILGILYPPLVIRLAEEGGFLMELEKAVLDRVLQDRPEVLSRFGEEIKISFNVTGTTVVKPRFLQYCAQMDSKYGFHKKNLCLEVTEQAALSFDEETVSALQTLHNMGLQLAVDDFSMGQTSIHYLKDNLFDLIKLDGSLIRGMYSHQNNREIIHSIVGLADALGLSVLAEFVETEEQRETLHELGCNIYQGYLYSPAVFLQDDSSN